MPRQSKTFSFLTRQISHLTSGPGAKDLMQHILTALLVKRASLIMLSWLTTHHSLTKSILSLRFLMEIGR
jgi:hypothetical protein